jgi:hypothetical protein
MSELAVGGWMVKATVLSRTGGVSTERWFAVGEPSKEDAALEVQRFPGLGDATADARRMLAQSEIEELQLKPGEVRAWS